MTHDVGIWINILELYVVAGDVQLVHLPRTVRVRRADTRGIVSRRVSGTVGGTISVILRSDERKGRDEAEQICRAGKHGMRS